MVENINKTMKKSSTTAPTTTAATTTTITAAVVTTTTLVGLLGSLVGCECTVAVGIPVRAHS